MIGIEKCRPWQTFHWYIIVKNERDSVLKIKEAQSDRTLDKK